MPNRRPSPGGIGSAGGLSRPSSLECRPRARRAPNNAGRATVHKSRLAGFIIDCRTDDLDQAGLFWSQALGYPLKKSSGGEDAQYKLLDTPSDDLHIEVQK